jgi:hypothetical protein
MCPSGCETQPVSRGTTAGTGLVGLTLTIRTVNQLAAGWFDPKR